MVVGLRLFLQKAVELVLWLWGSLAKEGEGREYNKITLWKLPTLGDRDAVSSLK